MELFGLGKINFEVPNCNESLHGLLNYIRTFILLNGAIDLAYHIFLLVVTF